MRHLLRGLFRKPAGFLVLFVRARPGLLHVGKKNLVELGDREAAELLSGSDERDVADHLKRAVNALRFRIFDIAHLEAALQDRSNVKEAAVDRSEDHVAHVVNVDVAALSEGLLGLREIELLVELLREIALDQNALRGNEGRVEVRVFAVAETQNVVGFLADLLQFLPGGLCIGSENRLKKPSDFSQLSKSPSICPFFKQPQIFPIYQL